MERWGILLAAASSLLITTSASTAADFVRGDANEDGEASVADAVFIFNALYSGGTAPACWSAANVNGDRTVDLGDPMALLDHLFRDGPPIPAAGDDGLPCPSYGGGSPLPDPKSLLEVVASTAPGGRDRRASILLRARGILPIAGFSGRIVDPDGVLDGLSYTDPRCPALRPLAGVDPADGGFLAASCSDPSPGVEVVVGQVNAYMRRRPIHLDHEDGTDLLEIHLCLSPSARAGSHPLVLLRREMVSEDGRAIPPALAGGVLDVLEDVAPGAECPSCFEDPVLPAFVRGDANGDSFVDLSDPIATLLHLFSGEDEPPCLDAADANDSGTLDLSDAIAVLAHLFLDGGPLPPPNAPGADPTPDGLDCRA